MLKCKIQPPVLCCYADLYVSMVTDYKQTLRSLIMKLCVALFYFLKRRQREWTNPGLQNQTTQGVFVVCNCAQDLCTQNGRIVHLPQAHRSNVSIGPQLQEDPFGLRWTGIPPFCCMAQLSRLCYSIQKCPVKKKHIPCGTKVLYEPMGATVYLVKLYPFHTEAITRVGPRCDNLGRLTQQSNSGIEQG